MNYNFNKQTLEIKKYHNNVYMENVYNVIISLNEIKDNEAIRINYEWVLDFYEL